MADVKYYDVILKPVITEKSMNDMADKKYTFYVHTEATKTQIKKTVDPFPKNVRRNKGCRSEHNELRRKN